MYIFIPLIVFIILANIFHIFPFLNKYFKDEKIKILFIHLNVIVSTITTFIFLWKEYLDIFLLPKTWWLIFLWFTIMYFFLWTYITSKKNAFYYFISVLIQDICLFTIIIYTDNIWTYDSLLYILIILSFSFSHIDNFSIKDFYKKFFQVFLFWILVVFNILYFNNYYLLVILHLFIWIIWKYWLWKGHKNNNILI